MAQNSAKFSGTPELTRPIVIVRQSTQFRWTIPNFLSRNVDLFYDGTAGSSKEFKFRVMLLAKRRFHYDPSWDLKFQLTAERKITSFLVKAEILDKVGKTTEHQRIVISRMSQECEIPTFMQRSWLTDELLPKGALTLSFEIFFEEEDQETLKIFQTMSNNFGRIMEHKKFTDFTLKVQGKNIKVHKNILAARSSVFEAMFCSKMSEVRKGHAEIEDIEHDVMLELLSFIYTGTVGKLDTMALKLLVAADKYALTDLKKVCEDVLPRQLTVDNVFEIVMTAELHGCANLQAKAVEFIVVNISLLTNSDGLASLTKAKPDIILEILKQVGEKVTPATLTANKKK